MVAIFSVATGGALFYRLRHDKSTSALAAEMDIYPGGCFFAGGLRVDDPAGVAGEIEF